MPTVCSSPHDFFSQNTDVDASVSVGSPPQLQTVWINTDVPNFVLYQSDSPCQDLPDFSGPCTTDLYDPSVSTTYRKAPARTPGSSNFTLDVNSTSAGTWASEVVDVGDVDITSVPFGLVGHASPAESVTGVLGVGYRFEDEGSYPDFLNVLVQAGAIASRLYSLFLESDGKSCQTKQRRNASYA